MTQRAYWSVAIGGAALSLFAAAAWSVPQHSTECRAIPDAMARLACYDAQNNTVLPAPPLPSTSVPPARPAAVQPVAPRTEPSPPLPGSAQSPSASADPIAGRASFDSRIAKVTALRHGLYRLDLEDGSAWNMTVAEQPPEAGTVVHFRRTILGTRFFDVEGRRPISVRPAK